MLVQVHVSVHTCRHVDMYMYFDMKLIPVEQFLHQLGGEVDVVFLACHTPGQQLATGEVISQAIVRSGTVIAQCQSTMYTNYTH